MNKIDKICLIDDDMIFQFLAQKVIKETHLVNEIVVFSNGRDAIQFLKSVQEDIEQLPDIIFLDLSMPIMDGWGFLDEYSAFQSSLPKKIPIYIVSSSIDPTDIQKSRTISLVKDFIIKPMTKEKFQYIIKNHFADIEN